MSRRVELGQRRVDEARGDAAPLEVAADLGHRAITVAEEAVAQVERGLELCLILHGAQRYAARLIAGASGPASAGAAASTGAGASAPASASIGSTASRSMASAS